MQQKYVNPLHAWALSLGCAVGWGAFVMPATTLLPIAGTLGTAIAMTIGAFVIMLIAANFHIMMKRTHACGGPFAYTKAVFGYDHSFLCVWLLALAYISILWANATAFVLISRFLFGSFLQWGFHYTVVGYDVYLGEICLTLAVIFFFGLVTSKSKMCIVRINTLLALILFFGVITCVALAVAKSGLTLSDLAPAFANRAKSLTSAAGQDVSSGASVVAAAANAKPVGLQILTIVVLAPWAFVGFESVSLASHEFTFSRKWSFCIMSLSVLSGALIYVLLSVLSVSTLPDGCTNWQSYIMNLSRFDGIDGLPTFHAARTLLGKGGLVLLGLCVLCALSTSMFGLYRSIGRLLQAMGDDDVLPAWFGRLNKKGLPQNAIRFVMLISAVIPFLGRTAIGWIVDVTTISASIVYAYISACTFTTGRRERTLYMQLVGAVGVVLSAVLFFFPLVPNLWNVGMLATESYIIFAVWSIVGFVLFRALFQHDKQNRFGKSTAMWISMLFLILFSSTMGTRQIVHDQAEAAIESISEFHQEEHRRQNLATYASAREKAFMEALMGKIQTTLLYNSLIQIALILCSLAIMFSIFSILRKREQQMGMEKLRAEEMNKAKTVFLSNMSHDIRTPMNAIIGYTALARKKDVSPDQMQEFLEKIDSSSKHLLALINDVLEMSRIESGKVELEEAPCDLRRIMEEVRDMFATQMETKGIVFTVDSSAVQCPLVYCDKHRLNRVLLNLISNACKFTPEGGSVAVVLSDVPASAAAREAAASIDEGPTCKYVLRVKDSGIGMSEDFAKKVFEAFERENTSTVSGIQGTGLGMAITKSLVDMMGGDISVHTVKNAGTEFVISLCFRVQEEPAAADGAPVRSPVQMTDEAAFGDETALAADATSDAPKAAVAESGKIGPLAAQAHSQAPAAPDFTKMRLLLVDDVDVNREIAVMLLTELGFAVDTAVNGKHALECIEKQPSGFYSAVLMDIQMPVMDGYASTRAIRSLQDAAKASVPIIAMTANAFSEDRQKALDAGMNAHIAKPIDIEKLTETLKQWVH